MLESLVANPDEAIRPITVLLAAIEEYTGERSPVHARRLREMAVDRHFPAVRRNNRWFWREADLPAIVAALYAAPAEAA